MICLLRHGEFVANPLDGLDEVLSDLFAQTTDVYVDGAVHHDDILAPDVLENGIPFDHLALVAT